ncbi:nuclease-related domain-containing protein [Intrasporangium sp. YIM S08009]|uniref:nuclease-related domain-containing protein n=1 Tax=Intrasporangium zincisolvens TaxID=3080018 RepID=UPI002B05AB32|nr:nuclease-related domain-containing protein [Intrasporangium sp. YIM S08009]
MAESLDEQARRWDTGATGERLVAAELGRLSYPWCCLHDLLLRPGSSRVNLDHVVIGPAGIFLIDTKNWSGGVSEYDGTLWQHTGSSRSQRASVEQVGRAAGEMERTLGTPVVPVIALAGPSTASFEPRRVGGIDVVPLHRLRAWLVAQPGDLSSDRIELTRRRIDHAFPPASAPVDPPGQDTTGSKVDDVLATGATQVVPERTVATRSRRTRGSSRNRPRRGHARGARVLRGLVGLALLAMLCSPVLGFLLHVASRVAVQTGSSGPGPQTGAQHAARQLSCQDYPVKGIRAVVAASVTPSTSNTDDRCSWFLGGSESSSPELGIAFGRDTRIEASVYNSGRALATAQSGSAVARVGAGQHLRQWADKTLVADDALVVRLDYRYPEHATQSQRRKADEAALDRVARLSEDFARWMYIGG